MFLIEMLVSKSSFLSREFLISLPRSDTVSVFGANFDQAYLSISQGLRKVLVNGRWVGAALFREKLPANQIHERPQLSTFLNLMGAESYLGGWPGTLEKMTA